MAGFSAARSMLQVPTAVAVVTAFLAPMVTVTVLLAGAIPLITGEATATTVEDVSAGLPKITCVMVLCAGAVGTEIFPARSIAVIATL